MKSLLITYDYPPIISGIGTVFYNIWKNLSPDKNLILAPSLKGAKEIDRDGRQRVIRYISFTNSRIIRISILIIYTSVVFLKEKTDVLLCGVPLSMGFIGLVFKKIFKTPYCVFYYGGEYEKYKTKKVKGRLLKKILKEADFIITNSEYTKKDVQNFGISEEKIFKIMPAVDIANFRPDIDVSDLRQKLNLNNKKVLLTVSRLVKRKGIDFVINMLPGVIREFPDLVYLIVGHGEEKSYLDELIKERGLEKNVIFCGSVSDEDLPKYYNLCDIYIMLNKETEGSEIVEGFGISFIEASACAKPVIGGISGGVKDAIIDGVTGFLTAPWDTQKITQTILKFLKEETYAVEFGRNGRRRVERDFRWEERAQRLEVVLENVRKNLLLVS